MRLRHLLPALVAATLGLAGPAYASWTCTTVVARNDLDPFGFPFGNRYGDTVAVNAAGDVAFTASALAARERLYLYPAAGPPEIVAEGSGAAPEGALFNPRPFAFVSLNDAGDVVFRAGLESQGKTIMVREPGGPLAIAVRDSGLAPGGGTFADIREVGQVTSSRAVVFLAGLSDGSSGVFVHDIAAATTTRAVAVGDAVTTPPGRQLCVIKHAHMADNGDIAVRANTKVDCDNTGEFAVEGIFHVDPDGITEVALSGAPTPLGATVYVDVIGTPRVNASGKVAFEATVYGSIRTRGLFLWDGTSVTTVAHRKAIEPVTGGFYGFFRGFELVNPGYVVLSARLQNVPEKDVILELGTPSMAIDKLDLPPTDHFPAGASYRSFSEDALAVSRGGEGLVLKALVKDVVAPAAKAGIFRCTSAP